jgi:DNA-binding CsgD family transcriptional regulator
MFDFPADMVTTDDFDFDGEQEHVLGRRDSRDLLVFSSWSKDAQHQSTIALVTEPVALSSADFDGDGIPELAVALADARLEVMVSDSSLNFSLAITVSLPAPPCDLDVCVVDGHPALVVATKSCVHVLNLIQAASDGPGVSQSVRDAATHLESIRHRTTPETALGNPDVTAREREVVLLALKGMTARQIGAKLFITDRTVETHLARTYEKLGVRSRFELLARVSEFEPAGTKR